MLLGRTRSLPQRPVERERALSAFARRASRFARDQRPVRLLLGGEALALVLFTLIVPIEVVYAKESLGTTTPGSASCSPPGAPAS